MKVINIILASIIIYLGVGSTCFAQENDKALLERVDKVYRLIPIDLNTDELLQKINEVEKYVGLVIDSIESKEAKEKARLIQAKGLLWSLGSYVFETGDKGLKDELSKRIKGVDLDSPSLELLDDIDVANLLNGYFRLFMPDLSELDRATYVLYNIKSEKIRNPYVLTALVSTLKQNGYTDAIQGVIEDIELCSKTESTIQKAHELKAQYYPVRVGEMAPDFEMEDEFGKMVKLSDFRGKMVFIDVWATWCMPCLGEMPYFNELSKQFPNIQFVGISLDDNTEVWLNKLKGDADHGKVLELFSTDPLVRTGWDITGIPRFLLIDKDFKIISASAPRPSEKDVIVPLLEKYNKK